MITQNVAIKLRIYDDQLDLLMMILEDKLQRLQVELDIVVEDLQEAEIQITHKSIPNIVKDAWIKVRDEALDKQNSLQSIFDKIYDMISYLEYQKHNPQSRI
jgi:hypothetical protein